MEYRIKEKVKMKSLISKLFLVLAAVVLCASSVQAADINIFAAASMKEAVKELANNFNMKNPGAKFINNFGASGALAKQIENGAPADWFVSANLQWMDYLKDKKLMDEKSISTFAFNTLVFVGKPDLKVTSMQGIIALDKIAIGSPKSVPAGEYADKAIKKSGLDKQLENKLVMAKDVRACLMYADTGEVAGAFVYRTDAAMAKNVKILFTVPQDLYPRVTYPMGLTASGSKKAEAAAFHKYLQTPAAKQILIKYGFVLE
jgi:molybdate transport system substrate-binding protein